LTPRDAGVWCRALPSWITALLGMDLRKLTAPVLLPTPAPKDPISV
jgi:hypothetical protein